MAVVLRSRWLVSPVTALALLLVVSGCGSGGSSSSAKPKALNLTVIGDSIPYNSPEDCPGCTGFVDRYATALEAATGRKVRVNNYSEHNGLTLPQLLAEMPALDLELKKADVLLVGIAHNSNLLAEDAPCGSARDANENPKWALITRACSARSVAKHRPEYVELFHHLAGLRAGKQTLLRTVNRYNDAIGYTGIPKRVFGKTKMILDAWNSMLCSTAEAEGFGCADIYHAINGRDGLTAAGDLLADDYTHPSDKGNTAISEVLVGLGFKGVPG